MAFIGRMLFLLFFIEMLVFIGVVAKIGFITTLLLWVLSVVGGGALIRQGGIATLISNFTTRPNPNSQGLYHLIAGILLIFPGFISDIIAIIILLPWGQNLLNAKFSQFDLQATHEERRPYSTGDEQIIEGEFEVIKDDKQIK